MTLEEAQDVVQELAPRDYYATTYRAPEASYLPHLCERLEDLSPGRFVDVGPGWGTMAVWLADRGWTVDVVDFVDIGVFIAQELLDRFGIKYHRCLIETDKTLPELQADLVTMTQVFGHLRYRPDNAIRRVQQFMPPGGLFVCSNLDGDRHSYVEHAYADWTDMPVPGDGRPIVDCMVTCTFDLAEYRALLGNCFGGAQVYAHPVHPILFGFCRDPKDGEPLCASW